MTIEAKGRLPHQHHLPSLREILREMNQHRTSLISATVLTLGGIYGLYSVITGSAGNNDTGNSTKSGAATPEPENGLGVTLVPTSTATSIPPEPTATAVIEPTKAPTVQAAEVLPIAEVPNHLDTLSASVNSLSKPYWNDPGFEERKKDIVKTIEVIQKDLKDNKLADARTKLAGNQFNVRRRILELGDPLKGERNVETKAKYDPENRFTQYPDLVDPRIKESLYTPVMEVYYSVFYSEMRK